MRLVHNFSSDNLTTRTYVSSIINNDIDAAEFIDRFDEGGFYLLDFRDI